MQLNEEAVRDYERLYDIKLSDQEHRLLTTSKQYLDQDEQQRQYLLGLALAPAHCPACDGVICPRSTAVRLQASGYGVNDDDYRCNRSYCHVKLHFNVGLIGGEQWFTLQPGQTTRTKETT